MGYFQPVGSVAGGEEIYDEINDVDGFSWQTYPHANHDSALGNALAKSGITKSSSQLIKKGSATKIETQTLYFCDQDSGYCGFIQFLNSSVLGGFYKSFEMNIKVFNVDKDRTNDSGSDNASEYIDYWKNVKLKKPSVFTPLEVSNQNMRFIFRKQCDPSWDEDTVGKKQRSRNFYQEAEAVPNESRIGTLSVEGQTEELSISLDVNIGKGFKIKPDGRSFFSRVPMRGNPNVDRCIRHVFAPNCTGSGHIVVNSKKIKFHSVPMVLITALQGLKPNSAAKSWNFAAFMSPRRTILCMEFTTPKEYGEQTVTISSDTNKITSSQRIYCGIQDKHKHVKHFGLTLDPKTGVEYPNIVEIPLPKKDGELCPTLLLGPLNLINVYNILQEMPTVLKGIVEKVEGINPYLYQFCQRTEVDDERAISLVETTFISP